MLLSFSSAVASINLKIPLNDTSIPLTGYGRSMHLSPFLASYRTNTSKNNQQGDFLKNLEMVFEFYLLDVVLERFKTLAANRSK